MIKIYKLDLKSNKQTSFREFEKDFQAREFVRKILDEKLKLLALKAKLKNITDVSSIATDTTTKKYTFETGITEKNVVLNDLEIEKSIDRAIHFLGVEILYSNETVTNTITK